MSSQRSGGESRKQCGGDGVAKTSLFDQGRSSRALSESDVGSLGRCFWSYPQVDDFDTPACGAGSIIELGDGASIETLRQNCKTRQQSDLFTLNQA